MADPVFTSKISIDGPRGNIYAVLGTACRWLRELDRENDATKLTAAVTSAGSYRDALTLIAKWFPLTCDGEPYDPEEDDDDY